MPTYNQRAITIADAVVVNGTATQAQRDRLAAPFAAMLPSGATAAQISEQLVRSVRGYLLGVVLEHETHAGISAVREAKTAQIPIDFAEAP